MVAEELVRRLRETRDPEVFRGVVEAYQDRVFRLVASVLGPYRDADAEDVVQEVFLRAYQKIDQFQGEASIGAWIYRIAWTQAMNRKQRARFRLPHLPLESIESLPVEALGDERLIQREERARIAHHLEQLPDVYRVALYLRYWLDAGIEEIAESLGVPAGTVKSYLSRGRDRLRRSLERAERTSS